MVAIAVIINTNLFMAKKKEVKKPMKPEWVKFCTHYVEYGNATQSYLYAYPNSSYAAARTDGSRLLTNADIAEYVEQLTEEFNTQYKQDKRKTVRDLIQAAEEAKAMAQFPAYAKLREMIIKMEGFYEPDKIEHSGIAPIQINLIQPSEPDEEDKQD